MVFRPVGDLPPSVYWVRRLAVLLAVVVLLLFLWWRWPSGGDDTPPSGAEQTPSPTVSATETNPTDSTSPEPSASETKTNKPQSNEPPCKDSAMEVTVATDAKTYTSTQQPAITFAVENVSDQACSRDVGQAANEIQITSGGTQVWSSDDCNPGGAETPDDLKPGDRFVQTVTWARVQSSEGCPTPQEDAPPGTYQVIARNGDVLSEPAVFVLE